MSATVVTTGLPMWQSHKKVRGDRITQIEYTDCGTVTLHLAEGQTVQVSHQWNIKHHPQKDWYFVSYDDGYTSCSPPAAFENGYTRIWK